MRSVLYAAVLFLFFCQQAAAQSASNYYNNGKAAANQANTLLAGMVTFDKTTNDKIISLYKAAADDYIKAGGQMTGIAKRATYNAAISLYHAALQYQAAGEDGKAYDLIKQCIDLWPTEDAIPGKTIAKEKAITRKSYVYIFPAADSIPGWNKNYYMTRYLMSVLSAKKGQADDALKYAEEFSDNYEEAPAFGFQMSVYASEALNKQGQTCDAGKYALTGIENASKMQLKEDAPDIALMNKKIGELERYLGAADSQACMKNKKIEEGTVLLAGLQAPWKPKNATIHNLGEDLFVKGAHSFQLLFGEYRLATLSGDSVLSHAWYDRLQSNKRHFSSADWRTLAAFYDNYLSKTKQRDEALEKARRKELQESTSYLIGIDPTAAPLGQYAASFQIMNKKVSHEFRFGYIANGIKPYLKSDADTEKVPLYLLTHYSGMQFSYAIKFLTKGEYNPNAYSYLGAEFRYTIRNYTDPLTYYNKNDTAEHFKGNLKPMASVYDATLIFGEIIKGKTLFFEIFGGMGLGYKTLVYTSPGSYNSTDYLVANAPYKADLWNKFYVPVRFGVKVGFVVR